jgi:hypothetical protein
MRPKSSDEQIEEMERRSKGLTFDFWNASEFRSRA